ncbi:MAG: carboxymuconolactone decarboxylase family protein [Dokdonella sp.]|nr:carboxymuconolactone decarboxylase family protein [Dokdonella sp.]MCB1571424.1 carboxymuconolactone decarboxylase family protein [Xanthomonadales bacterium]MCB1574145.1 carboxymuconolactone decarboxylase family protein [Xanthomonadales bacterium]MCB1578943.1 carboxymuconolactone decarboxylase family protein [Xanthomonadales bacterium]
MPRKSLTGADIDTRTSSAGEVIRGERVSKKTKVLIAFAIAITVRCDGCLAHHALAVHNAGTSREEVAEMIGAALLMGGGPSSVYGVEAMRANDGFAADPSPAAMG